MYTLWALMGDYNVHILRNRCTLCVPICYQSGQLAANQSLCSSSRSDLVRPSNFKFQHGDCFEEWILKEKHKRCEILHNCYYNTYYKSVIRYDIIIVASWTSRHHITWVSCTSIMLVLMSAQDGWLCYCVDLNISCTCRYSVNLCAFELSMFKLYLNMFLVWSIIWVLFSSCVTWQIVSKSNII